MNYYNEFDPRAAAWLVNLIKAEHECPLSHLGSSTNEVSSMSNQKTSLGTPNAISSAELRDGVSHSNSQEFPHRFPSGQEVAHALRSPMQENEKGKTMSDTSGQPSSISSKSAALNSSLANNLRTRFDMVGSMIYKQTWKEKVTPAGTRYWAHTASARTTKGKDCTGGARELIPLVAWPTITATDAIKGGSVSPRPGAMGLSETVPLSSWPTPKANDTTGARSEESRARSAGGCSNMKEVGPLAAWATATNRDYRYPNAKPYEERGGGSKGEQLNNQVVHLASWGSPRASETGRVRSPEALARAKKRGGSVSVEDQVQQTIHQTESSPTAETESSVKLVLNPKMAQWLMGFPSSWSRSCPGWKEWDLVQQTLSELSGVPVRSVLRLLKATETQSSRN